MVRGETNADIARALVVSEGTSSSTSRTSCASSTPPTARRRRRATCGCRCATGRARGSVPCPDPSRRRREDLSPGGGEAGYALPTMRTPGPRGPVGATGRTRESEGHAWRRSRRQARPRVGGGKTARTGGVRRVRPPHDGAHGGLRMACDEHGLRAGRGAAARAALRDPRRRHRDRARAHCGRTRRRARTRRSGAPGRSSTQPDAVRDVHRAYLDAGCDVISTNTWGLTGELDRPRRRRALGRPCTGWTSPAAACASAREAIEQAGPRRRGGARVQHQRRRRPRGAQGDARAPAARVRGGPARPRPARDDDARPRRPDVRRRRGAACRAASRSGSASAAAATACAASSASTGAARRATSSAAPRGASRRSASRALLINCLPPDHVPGMLPWLRDFTDLPLGVYPNLGYYTADGWSFDRTVDGADVRRARRRSWRDEGAQIVGGCCGTRPEHIAAARERVRDQPLGRPRAGSRRRRRPSRPPARGPAPTSRRRSPRALARRRGPTPVPARHPGDRLRARRLRPDPGQLPRLEAPLPARGSATGLRCLDIGCGTGLLAIQLALQRRRARARDRHRPPRGRQHALERVPQRRRRPR